MQYILLLHIDLQTTHHLLHHEGDGLTDISSTSGIISVATGATHSRQSADTDTYKTCRGAQKGQLLEKLPQ